MIQWRGETYIAYVSSPYHFSNEGSTLHIKHSNDFGRTWAEDSTFNPKGNDIRIPKFAVIGDRLFLYALNNAAFNPEPSAIYPGSWGCSARPPSASPRVTRRPWKLWPPGQ